MILADRFHYPEAFYKSCADVLDLALEHVPLYKTWKRFDPGPNVGCGPNVDPGPNASLDRRFDALPVLGKADMRAGFPRGLMPDFMDLDEGLRREEIEYTFTSGTTSEKVVNIWDQDWWDRSEAASWKLNRRLAALPYPQRQAKLASSLNVGISCEEDLPMTHRTLGRTLYLNEKTSVIQWQPRHFRRMVRELNEYRPVILEANPSLLARLAWFIADTGAAVSSPDVIVFTFEFPSAIHLAAIRAVFPSSALVSSYGSTETGFVMEQCADGLMHQNTAFCRIDFEPARPEYGGPELGRIFVTTFSNPWNVVIRFDVGDLVRLHGSGACACGIGDGMIADAVEGRVGNVTFGPDGRLVTTKMLDDALADLGVLRDYHLEQTGRSRYVFEAMLTPGADAPSARERLRAALREVYGGGDADVVIADAILPGPAGKYRRTQAVFDFDESGLFK